MERAVGYIRVSTKKQAEQGISMDVQMSKIRKYCDLHDFELVTFKIDTVSAEFVKKRKGATEVFQMAKEGKVDHVVVYKLDRLFRNAEESLFHSRILKEQGVELHSLTESIDTSTPLGKFFFTITAAYAEMERGLASERTQAVFDERREQNLKLARWTRLGIRTTGEKDNRGKSVQQTINDVEMKAVLLAQSYRSEGLSYRQIAARLFDEGFSSRTNNVFSPSTIKLMLEFII